MSLSRRVRRLESAPRPAPPARPLPGDPASFARALLAGEFGVEDVDPAHPDHTGWLCRMHAFLGTLTPEHQARLGLQRQLHPRAYPDALLLPASEEEILAVLDEVMRRG